ncbi:hypothetical protein NBRC116495_37250 [Aurantivibrio plasticivorans]
MRKMRTPLLEVLRTYTMEQNNSIKFEYSKENLLVLLECGARPKNSPYSHKQIAEWCEKF